MPELTIEHLEPEAIAAPITAPGKAAVTTVRISGSRVPELFRALSAGADRVLGKPRTARLADLRDLASGAVFDTALCVYFPGPRSYTGEDCLELSLHGSPFLLSRLFENLRLLEVRLARPGEFTERAFHNGRIDLTQAEAVCDLVSAETEAQARTARDQLEGKLSHAVSDLGEPLRDLLSEIEAHIDFPEEDIEPLTYEAWSSVLLETVGRVRACAETFRHGRLLREGAKVVLAGVPNAGKSSLLNWLLGEDRAIVTPVPGTTRDSIEERITVSGLYLRLFDTAGLDDESVTGRRPDQIESLGIGRSWKLIREADLTLFIADPGQELLAQREMFLRVSAEAQSTALLVNKTDLIPEGERKERLRELSEAFGSPALPLSVVERDGLPALHERLYAQIIGSEQYAPGALLICNRRHYDALLLSLECLERAREASVKRFSPDIVSFELRAALGALNDIIGVTNTEDILGRIFSKFCIGK